MERVHLVDNPGAEDPTWEELVAFLLADGTDRREYVSGSFVCADFAEELHNNAEAAGLRAAYVAVAFHDESPGHALNAFCTVDRGLVFVDCTHSSDFDASPGESRELYGIPTGWDKVAYVDIGRVYGLVSLEEAVCPAYECYEDHKALADSFVRELEEYNAEVDAYNDWVGGQVFIEGSDEHRQATEWQAHLESRAEELDALGDSLGAFWQPMGTVMEIDIYW